MHHELLCVCEVWPLLSVCSSCSPSVRLSDCNFNNLGLRPSVAFVWRRDELWTLLQKRWIVTPWIPHDLLWGRSVQQETDKFLNVARVWCSFIISLFLFQFLTDPTPDKKGKMNTWMDRWIFLIDWRLTRLIEAIHFFFFLSGPDKSQRVKGWERWAAGVRGPGIRRSPLPQRDFGPGKIPAQRSAVKRNGIRLLNYKCALSLCVYGLL